MLGLGLEDDPIAWLELLEWYMHTVFGVTKNLFSLEFVRTSTQRTREADNLGADLESNLTSLRREASLLIWMWRKYSRKLFQHYRYSIAPKPLLCLICPSPPASEIYNT